MEMQPFIPLSKVAEEHNAKPYTFKRRSRCVHPHMETTPTKIELRVENKFVGEEVDHFLSEQKVPGCFPSLTQKL